MNIVTVDITQSDIERNLEQLVTRITSCPIFLGSQRVIPNLHHVNPRQLILSDEEGGLFGVELPTEAKQFLKRADTQASVAAGRIKKDPLSVDQEPLKPFKFTVYIPPRKAMVSQ